MSGVMTVSTHPTYRESSPAGLAEGLKTVAGVLTVSTHLADSEVFKLHLVSENVDRTR